MKYSKTFPILAVALTLAFLVATLPATPALAQGLELTPSHGKIGQSVAIFGYHLTPNKRFVIYFSNELANPGNYIGTQVKDFEIVVTGEGAYTTINGELDTSFLVPSKLAGGAVPKTVRPGTYYVYIAYYDNKQIAASKPFTVESTGRITLDPQAGAVATKVKISGEGFANREDIKVEYDGASVAIQSGDRTDSGGKLESIIVIPESTAGKHTITVIGKDSGVTAGAEFTTAPKITITPQSGTAGDTVAVNGTGFGDRVNFSVFFADVVVVADKATSRKGSFEVTFVVPPKAPGSYEVRGEDEKGNSDKLKLTIMASAISLSPVSGYAGTEVTVSGSGFKANKPITITFDNEDMPATATNELGKFTATFTVPVRTTGTYKVKASDGTNTAEANFDIGTSITISPTTSVAAPGHVGTGVTISGVGFRAGSPVTVTYDGNQVASVMVNTDGSFSAKFPAPASLKGAHTIIATDGTNTQQFTFVMESTPPAIPVPLKPEMGIKAKSQAYFDWEEITDPSGVTYTLQIATKKDFSADSIVLERTIITTSEYTLTKEERLKSASKEAPYYWHVKAVDGASNAGGWSGTGAFSVGFAFGLSQGVRYTLFGIGALLLFIFSFWLGRRTAYY